MQRLERPTGSVDWEWSWVGDEHKGDESPGYEHQEGERNLPSGESSVNSGLGGTSPLLLHRMTGYTGPF